MSAKNNCLKTYFYPTLVDYFFVRIFFDNVALVNCKN